jgi:eukaryotic-like serine/threonine-protein kinase
VIRILHVARVVALSVVIGPVNARAQEAVFQAGATHAGVYRTAGVPSFGGLQWRVQTSGPVHSSPVVAGSTVYVGSSDGHVYAIDRNTGNVRWRHQIGEAVESSVAVANGMLYVVTATGVRAVRIVDGSLSWSVKTGAPVPLAWGHESGLLYSSSPVLVNGMVIFGSLDGHVYALDSRDGAQRWRFRAGSRVYSSPAVARGVVYFGDQRGHIHAIDLATGKQKWRHETLGVTLKSADFGFDRTTVQSSPSVADGMVFIGARDGFLYALDAATGARRWTMDHKVSWVNSTPAYSDGLVYAGTSDGHFVQAVDAASGVERWRSPTELVVWASPAVDAERVYVGDGSGTMRAFDKSTGREVWKYRVGARILSSAAVHEGRLYFGSDDGSVYAVNAAQGEPLRRALYFDSTSTRIPMGANHETVRTYLMGRGYEVLGATALAQFMTERVRDRAPSVVVFTIDHVPSSVAPVAADSVLFRRYLDAGGTVVWLGVPPFMVNMSMTSLKDLDREAPTRVLGVGFGRGNFDPIGARPTPEGRRLGLPEWYLDRWAANRADVTTLLAIDEQGNAVSWIKRFGGPAGTGFIRVFSGTGAPGQPMSTLAVQTAAELRPR